MLPAPRILFTALRYQMDAHRANPANLWAGGLGMFINNAIFLAGMWGLIFAGKPQNNSILAYYFSLSFVVMLSWGGLNFFLCGYRRLGDLITNGELEPLLATPRPVLGLVAIAYSSPFALGDLIMGALGLIWVGFQFGWGISARSVLATGLSGLGFAALFIGAGSLAFFIPRGANVSQFLIESMLSLTVQPSGKIFGDRGRMLVLLTPAAAAGMLPLDFVEKGTWGSFAVALGSALLFLSLALVLFRVGLRRYQAVSLIQARSH